MLFVRTLVVVRREERELLRQRQDLLPHGLVERGRVALLEVCAAAPADEEGVAGEGDRLGRDDERAAAWKGENVLVFRPANLKVFF